MSLSTCVFLDVCGRWSCLSPRNSDMENQECVELLTCHLLDVNVKKNLFFSLNTECAASLAGSVAGSFS